MVKKEKISAGDKIDTINNIQTFTDLQKGVAGCELIVEAATWLSGAMDGGAGVLVGLRLQEEDVLETVDVLLDVVVAAVSKTSSLDRECIPLLSFGWSGKWSANDEDGSRL